MHQSEAKLRQLYLCHLLAREESDPPGLAQGGRALDYLLLGPGRRGGADAARATLSEAALRAMARALDGKAVARST